MLLGPSAAHVRPCAQQKLHTCSSIHSKSHPLFSSWPCNLPTQGPLSTPKSCPVSRFVTRCAWDILVATGKPRQQGWTMLSVLSPLGEAAR